MIGASWGHKKVPVSSVPTGPQVSPHTGPGIPPMWLDGGGLWFPWNKASPPGVPCWLHVLPHKSPFAKRVQRCLSSRATPAATEKLPAAADVGGLERGKELPLGGDGHCGHARGEDRTERALQGGLG